MLCCVVLCELVRVLSPWCSCVRVLTVLLVVLVLLPVLCPQRRVVVLCVRSHREDEGLQTQAAFQPFFIDVHVFWQLFN